MYLSKQNELSSTQKDLLNSLNTNCAVRNQLKGVFYLYKNEAARGRKTKENIDKTPIRNITPQIQTPANKWTYRLSYAPAIKQFEANMTSDYFAHLNGRPYPFIAGASGHTGILLRGFLQLHPFEIESTKTYLLAISAFLIGGAMHSWHEIMHVAKAAGLPYEDGNYWDMLPRHCQENRLFRQLKREFPELMQTNISGHNPEMPDYARNLLHRLSS